MPTPLSVTQRRGFAIVISSVAKALVRIVPILVVLLFVRNLLRADSVGAVFGEYVEVVTDPAHMLTEMTFVLVEATILAPIMAFWVRRHDRAHHGIEAES